MALNITPITNHREREKGFIVYPVYSRRSEGLSIGINLFTGRKTCPFDCPYCEVFPFAGNSAFSLEQMESDLRDAILEAQKQNIPIKDICFSGNGEPTLSPFFPEALKSAEKIRAETAPSAKLVVITNGAGLLQPQVFSLLRETAVNSAAGSSMTDIWLKLDAGTRYWYQKMNRSSIQLEKLIEKIKEFVLNAPVTIQTMLCAIDGEKPPDDEVQAWETLMCELAEIANQTDARVTLPQEAANKAGGFIRKAQLYGKARAAPEDPKASALPAEYLEERAASLRRKFAEKGIHVNVDLYL